MTLHVVLYEPEIPGNTGAAIRLSANTGARLHLIEPLGFDWEDAKLRRAGLDYHEYATVQRHPSLDAFRTEVVPRRILALSAHGEQRYDDVVYADGDALLFGPESVGLPAALVASLPTIRIPMLPDRRSLNLSNAVAVTVYEAWRQLGFAGAR